jgi:hypothetical protein
VPISIAIKLSARPALLFCTGFCVWAFLGDFFLLTILFHSILFDKE